MFEPFTAAEAEEACCTLAGLANVAAQRVEPEVLRPVENLALYEAVVRTRKVLQGLELSLGAAVADSEQWKGKGDRSAPDRLAKTAGTTKKQAEEGLKTQKARKASPPLDDAVREGRVSPEQARIIADAVLVDPTCGAALVALAEGGASLGELAEAADAAKLKKEPDPEIGRKKAHRARGWRTWTRGHEWHAKLQLSKDEGARVNAAIEAELDRILKDQRSGEPLAERPTFDQLRADAATNLLTRTPTTPADPAKPGLFDDEPKRKAGPGLRSEPGGHLLARLDLAFLHGAADGTPVAHVNGLGPVDLATLAAILPDPWIQVILTRGKDATVANIGHRGADLWQQAVLSYDHPRCTNNRCHRRANLQNDHRVPYAVAQVTQIDNLDPLCPWCHHLKTHQGYQLAPGTGRRPLLSPTEQTQGAEHPKRGP